MSNGLIMGKLRPNILKDYLTTLLTDEVYPTIIILSLSKYNNFSGNNRLMTHFYKLFKINFIKQNFLRVKAASSEPAIVV